MCMVKKEIVILNTSGLHARPAASLVKLASKFSSKIKLQKDGLEVSAKSMTGVMMLGAEKGSSVVIVADGEDENEALEGICSFIENKLDEKE